MNKIFFTLFITVLFLPLLQAQDTTRSLVYKDNRPNRHPSLLMAPDLSYKIKEQFFLIKEANEGKADAQYELGTRYLLGNGFPADTAKGAYWLKKAVDQHYKVAYFNYGIMLLNGWAMEWNPFEAFKYFYDAAKDSIPNAEYITGLLYTDNLVVKRDWNAAYYWIKRAAGRKFEPAMNVLNEIKINVDSTKTVAEGEGLKQSIQNNSLDNQSGLLLIDFEALKDTTFKVTDEVILNDLKNSSHKELADIMNDSIKDNNNGKDFDRYIEESANYGSPEALVYLGNTNKKNMITAAAYYLRAIKNESLRAPHLLLELLKQSGFEEKMRRESSSSPEAMYVWYCLVDLGLDGSITQKDALNLLQKAADKKYGPALLELGQLNFTGKYGTKDPVKGEKTWLAAASLGSNEALAKIETAKIFGEIKPADLSSSVSLLQNYESKGSIIAQDALAYYNEAIAKNKGEADRIYRKAAQRGSRFAYDNLVRMYDEIREGEVLQGN